MIFLLFCSVQILNISKTNKEVTSDNFVREKRRHFTLLFYNNLTVQYLFRNALSQAEWDENTQRAIITIKKGNCWSYIGYTENSITYLYPEEALHLMETVS